MSATLSARIAVGAIVIGTVLVGAMGDGTALTVYDQTLTRQRKRILPSRRSTRGS
jgi:hypothetical protein